MNAKSFELATGETVTAFAKRLGRNYTTVRREVYRGYGCINRAAESNHPLYSTWHSMLQRCSNAKSKSYANYGGRGIRVCARWVDSFAAFCADMGPRQEKHQIDRINNNGDYSPDNCRWVSAKQNNNNKRNNVHLTFNGETRTVTEWADHLRVSASVLRERLRNGWTTEEALSPITLAASGHSCISITDSGKWSVRKYVNGKQRQLGTFTTLDVAIEARDGMSEVAV